VFQAEAKKKKKDRCPELRACLVSSRDNQGVGFSAVD